MDNNTNPSISNSLPHDAKRRKMQDHMHQMIFGISGPTLTEEEKEYIKETQPHGIILFTPNCQSKEQIIALNKSIKAISPDTKIFIDQEGGRVQRICSKQYPSMEEFGKIYDEDPMRATNACWQNFYDLMDELKDLGIDVTCAPVCDLRFDGASNIIGDRSFGSEVNKVVDLAKAALEGIYEAGGQGVIKHIPGHGRAKKDSHHELPVVKASLEELDETDFEVFRRLAAECDYAMTAHIIYECLDPDNPATTSKKVIDYIRDKIGFKGKIITDALEMHALSDVDPLKRAGLSIEAGCDYPLFCRSPNLIGEKAIFHKVGETN